MSTIKDQIEYKPSIEIMFPLRITIETYHLTEVKNSFVGIHKHLK